MLKGKVKKKSHFLVQISSYSMNVIVFDVSVEVKKKRETEGSKKVTRSSEALGIIVG